MERPELKGLIFDFDGTLANTLPVCIHAFKKSIENHTDRRLTDEEVMALFGPDEEGCIRQVIDDGWEECLQNYYREYEAAHSLCREPFPGVCELLRELQRKGMRLAIVTGKGMKTAEYSLTRLGLRDYFDAVEPGSAEGPIKPRGIRRILDNWNLPAEQIGYVGDAAGDVTASREAGTVPIAAAWAPTADAEALQAEGPAALFLRVEDFREWLNNGKNGHTN